MTGLYEQNVRLSDKAFGRVDARLKNTHEDAELALYMARQLYRKAKGLSYDWSLRPGPCVKNYEAEQPYDPYVNQDPGRAGKRAANPVKAGERRHNRGP